MKTYRVLETWDWTEHVIAKGLTKEAAVALWTERMIANGCPEGGIYWEEEARR